VNFFQQKDAICTCEEYVKTPKNRKKGTKKTKIYNKKTLNNQALQ